MARCWRAPGSDGDGSLRSNADVRRNTERRLDEAVETMLGRTLGADHGARRGHGADGFSIA